MMATLELNYCRLARARTIVKAVRIHYGTKNAVETVRQLQFECETISEFQLSHCLDGIFSPIINSEGLNTFV